MNRNMLLNVTDNLFYHCEMNEDGTNNGSLCKEVRPGHVYCIAKAPRYADAETWKQNCELIIEAIHRMRGDQ